MTATILATKLFTPPLRPNLVPRPHLVERLEGGLYRKLSLISAPAGSGKTTLVSEWLQASTRLDPKVRAAWLALDPGDNDLARFFAYLFAALEKGGVEIGQANRNLLKAPQLPPAESLLASLVNQIAASQPPAGSPGPGLVLVLDDLHAITELAVHKALEFLLERQAPGMHLVIITRQDPPLPLSRLRARDQLTEIRQRDLRFTPGEVAAFLTDSMKLELSEGEIATLENRTEGWIAGLQMAALSMQGRDPGGASQFIAHFTGRHHFILDYLTDEVLGRQAEPVQNFMLQTSVLEQLCGPLCDAILETEAESTSQRTLEGLEGANLFLLPLDDERRWYRYHHLFAELLRARLEESQPGRALELHRRAAAWYEESGLFPQAVHHALATQDLNLAADVIQRSIMRLDTWPSADVKILLRWLEALPDEIIGERPWLQLFASRALYVGGQQEAGSRILDELERSLRQDPAVPDAERILGLVHADRASYAVVRGEVRTALEYARQALAHIPKDEPIARIRAISLLGLAQFRAGDVGDAFTSFSEAIDLSLAADLVFLAVPFYCHLAEILIAQGKLRQAHQICQETLQLGIIDGKPLPTAGFVGLCLGKILYQQNDLPAAERRLLDGVELLRGGGIAEVFGNLHATLALIRGARGDEEGAERAINHALQATQGANIPRLSVLVSAYQVRLCLAVARQDSLDLAAGWASDYSQLAETEYLREFEDLTLVRVWLLQHKTTEALSLLDNLLPPAESAGRSGSVIEILALRALARHAQDELAAALDDLTRALEIGRPEGYLRLFLDEGEPMAALLRQAAVRGIEPEYVGAILAAFPTADPTGAARVQPLVEPLTGREIEVLELLAAGLTNPEIAARLVISLPTVKSHTRNIYGKLNVHSRADAVARARSLGILPPLSSAVQNMN